jgi:polysaccharide deacetylase family protein (PEP-CTERM system associated)
VEGFRTRLLQPRPGSPPQHAFTVDLEDWQQSVYDVRLPVSDRFMRGTDRIVELLDRHNVRATFFVLGNLAERFPATVQSLHRAGHEIQTHGYGHIPVHRMQPREFEADVTRARKLLEDLIGESIRGYRAPSFSLTGATAWALDALAACGFAYDSSIFPMRIRGYGIEGWCRRPHWIRTRSGGLIVELPVSTAEVFGHRVPVAGGGYFRLLPYAIIRAGLRQIESAGEPAIIYCHPHEFDPEGLAAVARALPYRRRLHQGLGRRRFAAKIDRMLTDFRFGPLRDLLPAGEPAVARPGERP